MSDPKSNVHVIWEGKSERLGCDVIIALIKEVASIVTSKDTKDIDATSDSLHFAVLLSTKKADAINNYDICHLTTQMQRDRIKEAISSGEFIEDVEEAYLSIEQALARSCKYAH